MGGGADKEVDTKWEGNKGKGQRREQILHTLGGPQEIREGHKKGGQGREGTG